MAIRLALNVEVIRLRELRSIPVGRGGPGQDHLIGWNVLPSQLDILSSAAEEKPDWRQVAQHFFYRGRHERWLTLKSCERAGMVGETENGVGNQVLGRPRVATFITSGTVATIL